MDENEEQTGEISIWIGRGISVLLFLFLGAFLVQHLLLIFAIPSGQVTTFTWIVQLVHASLLLGYLVSLFNNRLGTVFILIFSVLFFLFTVRGVQFWLFLVISLSPVCFYAYGWLRNSN